MNPSNSKVSSIRDDQTALNDILIKKVHSKLADFSPQKTRQVLKLSETMPDGAITIFEPTTTDYYIPWCASQPPYPVTVIKVNGKLYRYFENTEDLATQTLDVMQQNIDSGLLGAGASGRVNIAKQLDTGRLYPIKMGYNSHFLREVEILEALNLCVGFAHLAAPSINTKNTHMGYQQSSYIIMPYLGKNLKSYVRALHQGPISPARMQLLSEASIAFAYAVVRCHFGLDTLSGESIGHLDVKLDNTCYQIDDMGLIECKLIDYGASILGATKPIEGLTGTPPYVFSHKAFTDTKMSAWVKDMVMLLRSLTGVSNENPCPAMPTRRAKGLLSTEMLSAYRLTDILTIKAQSNYQNFTIDNALTITALLIAAPCLYSAKPDSAEKILEIYEEIRVSQTLAARIVCDYFSNRKRELHLRAEDISNWAKQRKVHEHYLTLVTYDLINCADKALADETLLEILNAPYPDQVKRAAAMLFKVNLLTPDTFPRLLSDEDMPQLCIRAIRDEAWLKLQGLLLDVSDVLRDAKMEQHSIGNCCPYIPGSEHVEYDDKTLKLIDWAFEQLKNFRLYKIQSESHLIFLAGLLRHRAQQSESFKEMLRLLQTAISTGSAREVNYGQTILRKVIHQVTDFDMSPIVLHFSARQSLRETIYIFKKELLIQYWMKTREKSLTQELMKKLQRIHDYLGNTIWLEDEEYTNRDGSLNEENLEHDALILDYILVVEQLPEHIHDIPHFLFSHLERGKIPTEQRHHCLANTLFLSAYHMLNHHQLGSTQSVQCLVHDVCQGRGELSNFLSTPQTTAAIKRQVSQSLITQHGFPASYFDKHQAVRTLCTGAIWLTPYALINEDMLKPVTSLYERLEEFHKLIDISHVFEMLNTEMSAPCKLTTEIIQTTFTQLNEMISQLSHSHGNYFSFYNNKACLLYTAARIQQITDEIQRTFPAPEPNTNSLPL